MELFGIFRFPKKNIPDNQLKSDVFQNSESKTPPNESLRSAGQ